MSWHGSDGLTSRVCPAADSASKTLRTTHCAGRTAQSAERAATQACPARISVIIT